MEQVITPRVSKVDGRLRVGFEILLDGGTPRTNGEDRRRSLAAGCSRHPLSIGGDQMAKGNSTRRMRPEEFRVDPEERPGWVRGSSRTPAVGEEVYCAGGAGSVASVHGKTGDGSRLLQIRLADETAPPFFAAASNVLILPR
jgi:hypothetical protein